MFRSKLVNCSKLLPKLEFDELKQCNACALGQMRKIFYLDQIVRQFSFLLIRFPIEFFVSISSLLRPIRLLSFSFGMLYDTFTKKNKTDNCNWKPKIESIGETLGRRYDRTGNMTQWWSDALLKEFRARADCFVQQYGTFNIETLDRKVSQLIATF